MRSGKKFYPKVHDFYWQVAKNGANSIWLYEYEKIKIAKHGPFKNLIDGGSGPPWRSEEASSPDFTPAIQAT